MPRAPYLATMLVLHLSKRSPLRWYAFPRPMTSNDCSSPVAHKLQCTMAALSKPVSNDGAADCLVPSEVSIRIPPFMTNLMIKRLTSPPRTL
jgi:hypothetical protein